MRRARKKLPVELEALRARIIAVMFTDVLGRVCQIGREAAIRDYTAEHQALTLEGSLHGFAEAESVLTGEELTALYEGATTRVLEALEAREDRYWFWRGRQGEIGWVCNVLGSLDLMDPAVPLTASGYFTGMRIIQEMARERGMEVPAALELGPSVRTTAGVAKRHGGVRNTHD